jgi:hypothetical protein
MLTLIGRTRTLSDVTDGRDERTNAQTTLIKMIGYLCYDMLELVEIWYLV